MSTPNDEQRGTDELDLEPETVKDLDVDDTDADKIVGGHSTISTAPGPN
jgi:hypothetical protein